MRYSHESTAPGEYDYTSAYREYGNGVYLAKGEEFDEVVAEDGRILAEEGLTAGEAGNSLRRLLSSYNDFYWHRKPGPQELLPGLTVDRQVHQLGQEYSPYLAGTTSNIDWRVNVEGLSNGNKAHHPKDGATFVSDMLPEMISELGFFEGSVFYGLQPEWVAAIHRLVQQHEPNIYEPSFSKDAWTACGNFGGFERFPETGKHTYAKKKKDWHLMGEEFPPDVVIKNASHIEMIDGAIKAFVANGNLSLDLNPWRKYWPKKSPNLWALLVAQEDVIISPDAALMGMPFDIYNCAFKKGDIAMWEVDPTIPAPKRIG